MHRSVFYRTFRPTCTNFKINSNKFRISNRKFSVQNYESLQKIKQDIKYISEDEEEEQQGEAKLVELEHPYKDSRYFLLGVPFTDVQRVEEVCNDLQPDYILVAYDQEKMDKICDLRKRNPSILSKSYFRAPNLRDHFDIMLYALMCGHHHLDPALEYCKKNNKPIYAVDRSEFLTTFRASTATVGRLPKMISTGKTVKILSPFLLGSQKIEDMTQEMLEDARESLDTEDVDFERQQLMKLPAYGEERGEIFAHRLFYFESTPGTKVLGIAQRSLFDFVVQEWGKTTDEDMHNLHLGPDERRKKRAKYLMGTLAAIMYTAPFYVGSAYFDPMLVGLMWASIPVYQGIKIPLKMRSATQRAEAFYQRVRELDTENHLIHRWREESTETNLGPEFIQKPEVYMDMDKPASRFSPKNFGDPGNQPEHVRPQ